VYLEKEVMRLQYSIKELRARHGLTQDDCAKIVGTTYQTWNAWESNAGMIKIKNAIKIAEMFKVSMDEIKW